MVFLYISAEMDNAHLILEQVHILIFLSRHLTYYSNTFIFEQSEIHIQSIRIFF